MATSKVTSADVDAFLKSSPSKGENKNTKTKVTSDDVDNFLASTTEEPGVLQKLGKKALEAVVSVGNAIDSVTGAPVRAAIGAYQDGESPLAAYGRQMMRGDVSKAPTGKEIAAKAGFSTEEKFSLPVGQIISGGMDTSGKKDFKFSPAGAVGLGIDIAADPTNVIPIGAVARGAALGASEVAKVGIKGAAMGADVLTGTKAATRALEYGGEKVNQVRKAIEEFSAPKRAADFEKYFDVARENNIPTEILPEAVEFGKESRIDRGARALAQTPVGQARRDKYIQTHNLIDEAVNKRISEIGGGVIPNREQAGKALRDGYDQAVENLYREMDVRHSTIAKNNPDFVLPEKSMKKVYDTVNEITQFAEDRLRYGAPGEQKVQAKYLLELADALRASNGTYENYYNFLQNVGKDAFKKQNTLAIVPSDKAKMKDLYKSLSEAMIEGVESRSPAEAAALRANNKKISEFLKQTEPLANKLGDESLAPEVLFDSIVRRGDSKEISSLKNILPADKFAQVKAAYLDSIIPRGRDGVYVNYQTLGRVIQKEKDRFSHIFNPDEAKNFLDIVDLGDRVGLGLLNYSETNSARTFTEMVKSLPDLIASDSIIEGMKAKARGQMVEVPQKGVKGFTGTIADPTRGYLYRKGAQTISTQNQGEKN